MDKAIGTENLEFHLDKRNKATIKDLISFHYRGNDQKMCHCIAEKPAMGSAGKYFCISGTGCSLSIVFFPALNVMILPNSASFVAAALVCYLPSGGPSIKSGVHTLTPREN